MLRGSDGFSLVITQIGAGAPQAYPSGFHVGFVVETADAVHAKHAELTGCGCRPDSIKSLEAMGAIWTAFYCPVGDGIVIEVTHTKPNHPRPVGPATDMIGEMDKAIDKDRSRKMRRPHVFERSARPVMTFRAADGNLHSIFRQLRDRVSPVAPIAAANPGFVRQAPMRQELRVSQRKVSRSSQTMQA